MRTAEEFWACVNKDGPIHQILNTKCWLWIRAVTKSRGYGHLSYQFENNIETLTHRVAWRLTTLVPIPTDLCVLHKCDNRKCVNPEHLFLGTTQDNTLDMIVKGRKGKVNQQPLMQGERNPKAVLTEFQVQIILDKLAQGESQRVLAREFNCCSETVRAIATGKTWKHLSRCSS